MNAKLLHSRSRRFCVLACWLAVVVSAAGNAYAGKPGPATAPAVYSDVRITFAGQTFGLAGVQTSFSQTQDGGRIAFDLTTVDTLQYLPLPEIDTGALAQTGNHWEVVTKLGKNTYLFVGTCASETYNLPGTGGATVRQLFLNCADVQSNNLP